MRGREDVEAVAAGVEQPLHADKVSDLSEGPPADYARDEVLRELPEDCSDLVREEEEEEEEEQQQRSERQNISSNNYDCDCILYFSFSLFRFCHLPHWPPSSTR